MLRSIGLALILCLISVTTAPAQGACSAGSEPDLRKQALGSSDVAVSQSYLSCFSYSDAAPSIRKHVRDLRSENECRAALASDDAAFVRNFISDNADNACATRALAHLKEIERQIEAQSVYKRYRNSFLTGTPLTRGGVPDMRACIRGCTTRGAACVGYSFDTGTSACTLWSALTGRLPRGRTESGSVAEVPLAAVAPPPPAPAPPPPPAVPVIPLSPQEQDVGTFEIARNVDIDGGDYDMIRGTDYGNCRRSCAAASRCRAFTFNTEQNACFLKDSVPDTVGFPGAVSGRKRGETVAIGDRRPAPRPQSPGTEVARSRIDLLLQNIDLSNNGDPGADYRRYDDISVLDCRSLCKAASACRAFTYNLQRSACILKRSYQSEGYFEGAFSGIK